MMIRNNEKLCFLILLLALCCSCGSQSNSSNSTVPANAAKSAGIPVFSYQVVNTFKHDPEAFTEGLFFYNGFLYESTGLEGQSDLRKVNIETGQVVQKVGLPSASFGEGITLFNGRIYQLTYREGICRVFDAETFQLLNELKYSGEGWGLTNDGKSLIMSNGSHIISFLNPETLRIERTISVFRESQIALTNLNELEYIEGEIWANVWHSEEIKKPNHIARIDPQTGKLLGWINLDGISPDDVKRNVENTLNGIAYDPVAKRIFVTGKDWRRLFEIKVVPQ